VDSLLISHIKFYFLLCYYLLITFILVQLRTGWDSVVDSAVVGKANGFQLILLSDIFYFFFALSFLRFITPTVAVTPASNWLNLSEGLVHKDSNGRYF